MSDVRAFRAASLDLLLGSTCVGCERPGPALCARCRSGLEQLPRRVWPRPCPTGLPPVWAVAPYEGAVRSALLAHKEEGRLSLAAPLGRGLALSVLGLLSAARCVDQVTLTRVPTRRAVVRDRGHDPMARLTRACRRSLRAAGIDASSANLLRQASGVADQAGLSAADRTANLRRAFVARRRARRDQPSVIVLDDIITTGATANEAARALTEAGFEVAGIAVVAATRRRLR